MSNAFNLPTEGQVFRVAGDNGDAVYKVVNGQLTTVASPTYVALTTFRDPSSGITYQAGQPAPNPHDVQWLDPNYRGAATSRVSAADVYKQQTGQSFDSLPSFNMADIQTTLQQTGSLPSSGSYSVNTDPAIQGYRNPNGVSPATGGYVQGANPNANLQTPGAMGVPPPQLATNTQAPVTPTQTPTTPTPTTSSTPTSGGTSTTGGGTSGALPPDVATLPPEFQQLYSQLNTYLQQLQQRGQVLNPNVEITPEQTASFLQQAKTEIDPYYSSQLKIATDALSSSLGYATQNEQTSEDRLQKTYGRSLENIGVTAADQGFAQSGIRQRNESDLAYNTNNQIQDARGALSQNAGNAARSFAQLWGGNALPTSTIGAAPRAIAGNPTFANSGGNLPLYQLSPEVYAGLTGSQKYQQNTDVANRASQLEGAFRSNQAITQARQLTL